MRLVIPDYAGTVGNKMGELWAAHLDPGVAILTYSMPVAFRSTSAITRLKVFTDTAGKKLKVGSQLLIYKRLAS